MYAYASCFEMEVGLPEDLHVRFSVVKVVVDVSSANSQHKLKYRKISRAVYSDSNQVTFLHCILTLTLQCAIQYTHTPHNVHVCTS